MNFCSNPECRGHVDVDTWVCAFMKTPSRDWEENLRTGKTRKHEEAKKESST